MIYLIKYVFQIKQKDLNLSVFTGKNESKTLTKHISCGCKCRFDGRKCNLDQGKEKNRHVYEKRLRLEYCYM